MGPRQRMYYPVYSSLGHGGGSRFDLNSHFVSRSDHDIDSEVRVNIELADTRTIHRMADVLLLNLSIVVPEPQSVRCASGD